MSALIVVKVIEIQPKPFKRSKKQANNSKNCSYLKWLPIESKTSNNTQTNQTAMNDFPPQQYNPFTTSAFPNFTPLPAFNSPTSSCACSSFTTMHTIMLDDETYRQRFLQLTELNPKPVQLPQLPAFEPLPKPVPFDADIDMSS